jgi:hypothetical protein
LLQVGLVNDAAWGRHHTMRMKSLLLWGAVSCAAALLPVTAQAQAQGQAQADSDFNKTDQLQHQMDQLQQQMKTLKDELALAKKKSANTDAWQNAYGADVPMGKRLVKAVPFMERVHITVGGFFAAESVWRQHNETADIGSNFAAEPFPFAPTYNESEFRGTARQSRLALLVEGNIDPKQKLSGYFESDFLGVGATSNYNQSNSWAPRLRQFYINYDNGYSGFHMLAGQAWSLITQNTVGITARKENIPLTIDASYVVGFEYTRNWQVRFVQEFNPMWTAAVSVEAPAEQIFAGGVTNGGVVNGVLANWTNPGSSFLGSGGIANAFTTDTVPDVIEKIAFDPGWAHFEVFGVQRFFTDNIFTCSIVNAAGVCVATAGAAGVANTGTTNDHTTMGAGVGGSFLWSIMPNYLDLSGMAIIGNGIGRYSAAQLPDVMVAGDGSLHPIREVAGMAGAVWHPWVGTDIYAYGGIEKENASWYGAFAGPAGGPFPFSNLGLGNPNLVNFGCSITSAASFSGGTSNCAGTNNWVTDITVGLWQNLYNGDIGRFTVGLEWELLSRKLFPGLSTHVLGSPTVAPSTNDNAVFTSIRWYPKYPTF